MSKDKKTAEEKPPVLSVAPQTAEDPSRAAPLAKATKAPSFPGYPKDKFHPVYGKRTVKDPNEEASELPGPAHNWFDTAEEADAHRTEREAQQAIHYNSRVKVDAALAGPGETSAEDPAVRGEAGIVRNSVAATESLKSGFPEPL